MGGIFPCCVREQSQANYDKTVDMSMIPMFPSLRIAFSSHSAHKIQYADCAIVNASKKHPQNQFYFKHISSKDLQQITSLITSDQPGTIEVVTNPIESLHVKDIIIMHLPVWGQPNADENLKSAVGKAFEEAVKRNHKTIVITEVEEERGIPTNTVYAVMISNMEKQQNKLERVMFNIQDPVKLDYFKKQLSGDRLERANSIPSSDLSK